jgi:predicted ATPase
MVYGLLAACSDERTLARAIEIIEQLPDIKGATPLPLREAQTMAMELLMQRALATGLEAAILDSSSYHRYAEARRLDGVDA